MLTRHASLRARERGIPPLIEQWLDEYGEEQYDGRGAVIRFFSRRSIRRLEQRYGSAPVRALARYRDAYKVEGCSDACTITVGHRTKRVIRR